MARQKCGMKAFCAGVAVCLTMGCDASNSGSPLTPEFAKGGGGGGGGGAKEISVRLDGFTDAVTVVPGASLVDGVDFVETHITPAPGTLWVDTFDGKPKRGDTVVMRICVDLSVNVSTRNAGVLATFTSAAGGNLTEPICTEALMHTSNASVGMPTQTIGSVEHAGGKIFLKEFATGSDSDEWRLHFDTFGDNPDQTQRDRGVCVERTGDAAWIISNGCDADNGTEVDSTAELVRHVGGVETPVADFDLLFSFVVTGL